MVSTKLIIANALGLHLRPINVLCNRAIDFTSRITIRTENKAVNAKSVLGLLSACVKYGDEIEIICDGPDEKEALRVITEIIQKGS